MTFSLCVNVSTPGESSVRGLSGNHKSIQVDVTGKPRRTKVRLPASILSSKACSIPNQQVPKHSTCQDLFCNIALQENFSTKKKIAYENVIHVNKSAVFQYINAVG